MHRWWYCPIFLPCVNILYWILLHLFLVSDVLRQQKYLESYDAFIYNILFCHKVNIISHVHFNSHGCYGEKSRPEKCYNYFLLYILIYVSWHCLVKHIRPRIWLLFQPIVQVPLTMTFDLVHIIIWQCGKKNEYWIENFH